MAEPRSVTGQYLKHPLAHTGVARRPVDSETQFITVRGAHLHNLKNIDVKFPLGRLIALTGVSGSGKSTLARDVLCTNLKAAMESAGFKPAGCAGLDGADAIDRVLEVDQTPIGKTPRSCPATYVGFFNQIRDLYAATPEAQARGYEPTRFSFNTAVGRCPVCEGQGEVTVEMNFLPDVKVPCEVCRGMRFDEETLQVKWQEKSIGDILNMPVDEAYEIFSSSPKIAGALKLLQDVGLGYLKLGQPSSTLSGGEAQRIKLVTELAKAFSSDFRRARRMPRTFYILDEPTVGLHMADVKKLIDVLQRLVDAGNTVLVVEHNLDVIAEADCVIDLGPEGGEAGGEVLAAASPVEVSEKATPTGEALRALLRKNANARK
jgi:excinuclease ABC subunit A